MSKIIPNENTWIGFTETAPADLAAPTEDELDAAITMTHLIVSLNASAAGNAIPTPALDSLFDRSITGTSQGQFTGDFYRDDEAAKDIAWSQLPRAKEGFFFISRFGGSRTVTAADALGSTAERRHVPAEGEPLEVWPIRVTSRVGSALTSNTAQTFNLTAAVPEPPEEDAVCAAGAGLPTPPKALVATAGLTGIVVLDWDAPDYVGAGITGYKVYKSTVAGGGGAYTEVTTNIVKAGTTATLSSLAAGLTYFKVVATNATGDSGQSAFASATVAA